MNLRNRGIPISFGSNHDRDRYLELVETARQRQVAEYVVAPKVKVKVLQGLLDEGAEVRPTDLLPEVDLNGHQTSGLALLHKLVQRGFVLAIEDRAE